MVWVYINDGLPYLNVYELQEICVCCCEVTKWQENDLRYQVVCGRKYAPTDLQDGRTVPIQKSGHKNGW